MKCLLASLALISMIGTSVAADKPNFSGEWKMNPSKSNYGVVPVPKSLTRKIVHSEPSITIAEDQAAGSMELVPSRSFTTDGHAASFNLNGVDVVGSVNWEDAALIVLTKVTAAGMQFNDRMSLSEDGKLLTSKVQITSDQGDVEMTIVFDRQ
jgi:hypothetical protein